MQRTIIQQLIEWKNNPDRKPLVLKGARQIGKTWILKEFGKTQYQHVAYIRCDNEPAANNLFADYNISRIVKVVEAITKVPIIPGKTLIIFDEIQEIKGGLHSFYNISVRMLQNTMWLWRDLYLDCCRILESHSLSGK